MQLGEFIDRPASMPLREGDRLWIVAPDSVTATLLAGRPD